MLRGRLSTFPTDPFFPRYFRSSTSAHHYLGPLASLDHPRPRTLLTCSHRSRPVPGRRPSPVRPTPPATVRPCQNHHPFHEHPPSIDKSTSQPRSATLPIHDSDQFREHFSGELGNKKSRPMPPLALILDPRPSTPPSHALSSLSDCWCMPHDTFRQCRWHTFIRPLPLSVTLRTSWPRTRQKGDTGVPYPATTR
ncbi:hypothetical protein LZ32DRAFT_365347 [Colletotrichum eremochloae]|nr:hypothetical protein LZ32DRAFT_365347 [Colletotrichum eremochloae]